uniref:Uncharacterized protein n=1 Tax=Anguilla anguilla TaxID=7936 RepID=A0A0E9QUM7_ANGAN
MERRRETFSLLTSMHFFVGLFHATKTTEEPAEHFLKRPE